VQRIRTVSKCCLLLPRKISNVPSSIESSYSYHYKVVIGDTSGTINVFEFNKGELGLDFKTPPLQKDITRVELSGPNYNAREKIYISAGTYVRGYSRKGKELFKLDTYLTEAIKSFGIEETRLWTAGEYFLNEYEITKDGSNDKSYFLCPDKINDMFIHNITETANYNPILACQDKGIRLTEDGNVLYAFMAQGAVNCLQPYSKEVKNPQTKHQLDRTMVFGLGDGSFVNILFEPDKPVYLWSAGLEEQKKKAGISLIKVYDFQNRGINDVVVVRDDSTIEVLSLNTDQEYEVQYSTVLNEGVTAVDAGQINVPGLNEFIVSTYSGKVLGYLDSEEVNKVESKKVKENPKDTEKKIKALRAEIDKLKQNGDQLKAEVPPEGVVNTNVNTFKVSHKIARNSNDASYSIHIDSQYPIEFVVVQSLVNVELLEVDSSIAILSLSSTDPDQKNGFAATYRFIDANVLKFEIKLRTIEGQFGDLSCFVIPNANPKTSQAFNIPLKPLSLHERYLAPVNTTKSNFNTLKITGEFSKSDIHTWIANCLPDFPHNLESEEGEANMTYKSNFVGTYLFLKYSDKAAIFQSESLSCVSIIKDVISQQASTRNVHINIQFEDNDQSIKNVLELLKPKFEYYSAITKKYQVLTALKEISNQEGNSNFLSKESREILENADEIQTAFTQQPKKLQYLKGIITDLYADRAKSKGMHNIGPKVAQLISLLNNFNVEALIQFFTH